MFRSFFIYLSKAAWAKKIVTGWPFVWRVAARFIAGEKLEDAIRVIKAANAKGINATLDHLGEHTSNAEEARQATYDILEALDAIVESGVRANVSIKLTQIGLAVDREQCFQNLAQILEHAARQQNFIRIDMEDSPVTQVTLDMLYRARQNGCENVGIVIQSYLYRSDEDIRRLAEAGVPVRLCKGAYKEPAAVAYPKKSDVDKAYDRLAAMLIDGALVNGAPRRSDDGKRPPLPALATHDVERIEFGKAYIQKAGLPKEAMEFQMLNGIRRDLQEQLVAEGYPVRIYVPYGTQWYPYFMRRLAERPANVWFLLANFFHK